MTWNGAGGWLIFSQSRQVNFSRTCWITFHWRGITSSVSVIVSPSLRSRVPPQQGQVVGAGTTTRSRGRCSGNGLRAGRLRVKAATVVVLAAACSAAISSSVAVALQLLELQLHLVEQPRRALRARAVELPLELLDLELLVRDHRRIVGGLGAGQRQLGLDTRGPIALGRQCRSQRLDVGRRIHGRGNHRPPCARSQKALLSRAFRPECVNRVTPVDPVERLPM